MVRQLQRGSHASVLQVKKVQTGDVFAMKVIDRQRGRSHRLATERKVRLVPYCLLLPYFYCLITTALPPTALPPHRLLPPYSLPPPYYYCLTTVSPHHGQVLFSCNSPFVVTTYFAFEDSQRLYLVMECLCSDCKHLLQASPTPRPSPSPSPQPQPSFSRQFPAPALNLNLHSHPNPNPNPNPNPHPLQERGVIPEAQAVSLAADVVLALEHLHAAGHL